MTYWFNQPSISATIHPLARSEHVSSRASPELFKTLWRHAAKLNHQPSTTVLMAPPGLVPPSYVGQNIPTRYMNKEPPPPGTDTNTRAYFIFFSYLGSCAGLSAFIIFKLLKSYTVLSKSTTARPPPRNHVRLFTGLAAGSLLTTWYYMLCYFQSSYATWLMWRSYYDVSDDKRHWGLWLKETSLFREAWEIAIVGNANYWWTHQIFFFACGLGLMLEQKGMPTRDHGLQ